jgi:RNA polymerase sigma-70 factor (ECF subfamily)
MTDDGESLLPDLNATRQQFLKLVETIRPDLHRYCSRMVGSVTDGEDIVQDALARAYYELSGLQQVPALRAWLFQIAHYRALDHLRRYEHRMREPLDALGDAEIDETPGPESIAAQEQALRASLSRFLELPPLARSCVVLKDVLGASLQEICELLQISLPAAKSALHRGRKSLRELAMQSEPLLAGREVSPALARYAALFNAHDWDAVRAMLAEDVKLELVSVTQRAGRDKVGVYFSNYGKLPDWSLVPGWLDGREVLGCFRGHETTARYFIVLTLRDSQVTMIRDFYHVPYIARDARFEAARDEGAR